MSSSSAQTASFTFDDAVAQLRAGETTADEAAERLIGQLTDEELLWLLDGDSPLRDVVTMAKKLSTVALSGERCRDSASRASDSATARVG